MNSALIRTSVSAVFQHSVLGAVSDTWDRLIYGVHPLAASLNRIRAMVGDPECPDWLIIMKVNNILGDFLRSEPDILQLVAVLHSAAQDRPGLAVFVAEEPALARD
ncbi:hypothetical protein HON52_00295 [Candidatus Uhrbacteria bacterium]|jgi:hypothetical protein|nr:hypothetical protein [Candidatus Uhrbacteria bacterium]